MCDDNSVSFIFIQELLRVETRKLRYLSFVHPKHSASLQVALAFECHQQNWKYNCEYQFSVSTKQKKSGNSVWMGTARVTSLSQTKMHNHSM